MFFNSMDGMKIGGTFRVPDSDVKLAAVLIHGITADREEGGFYTSLVEKLDNLKVASLRIDIRGHGVSDGKYEDLTLSGVINDIGSAVNHLKQMLKQDEIPLVIIGTSFGGGLSVYWTSENAGAVNGLVLLNPLFDYAKRMLYSKPFWKENKISLEGSELLKNQGWLPHGDFKMGRSLINELLYIKPYEKMKNIVCPVLTIHGDMDSMVPYEIAKTHAFPNPDCEFVTIEGADHGFTNPEDETIDNPETLRFRNTVYETIVNWLGKQYR